MYLFNSLRLLKITTTRSAFWVAPEALTWGYPSHNTGAFTVVRWVTSGHGWEKENVIDAWFEFDDQRSCFWKILKSLQMLFKIYLYSVCTTEMCEVVTVILFVCVDSETSTWFSAVWKSLWTFESAGERLFWSFFQRRGQQQGQLIFFFFFSLCLHVCLYI